MSWTTNPIMEWWDDRVNEWVKISDHGRSPLSVDVERIENKQRMANGTMRRYVVTKKRNFSCSWENLPNTANTPDGSAFLANGKAGDWMEEFHNYKDGAFKMRLRAGSDRGKETTDPDIQEYTVMITDFAKDIIKRGVGFDLWSLDMTLEEV